MSRNFYHIYIYSDGVWLQACHFCLEVHEIWGNSLSPWHGCQTVIWTRQCDMGNTTGERNKFRLMGSSEKGALCVFVLFPDHYHDYAYCKKEWMLSTKRFFIFVYDLKLTNISYNNMWRHYHIYIVPWPQQGGKFQICLHSTNKI